jgi:hypothetical protein
MKKVKVTKRPQKEDFILKPNRLRMMLVYVLLFGLAYIIGMFIRYLINPGGFDLQRLTTDWTLDALIIFGGPALLAMLDYRRWVVRLQNSEMIEGLSGAFGERVVFPAREIDWQRTNRSLSSRFKIGNAIYAKTRQRILLSPWFYNPGDFREFLQLIGAERQPSL